MTNSTVSSNRSYGAGGGIRNVADGVVRINYSTITQNEINFSGSHNEPNRFGGGIYTNAPAVTYIGNSIVAENEDNRTYFSDDFSPDCYSSGSAQMASQGQNIIGIKGDTCKMTTTVSDQFGGEQSPLDPMLDSLEDRVHMPQPGSPAIDGGHEQPALGFFFNYNCPYVDQNRTSRPVNGDQFLLAKCDIGAAEYFVLSYIIYLDVETQILDGATIDFGTIDLGKLGEKTLEFKNDGQTAMVVTGLELPLGFELTEPFEETKIEPGERSSFTVQMQSDEIGDFGGQMHTIINGKKITQNLTGQVREAVIVDPTPTPVETPHPTTELDNQIFIPLVHK